MHKTLDGVVMRVEESSAPSLGVALRRTKTLFEESGIETASLDARLLVAHAFGCDPTDLIWKEQASVSDAFDDRLRELVERRLNREPVAYILGRREFWNSEFVVTRDTLIPRPDSETVVEAVLELIPEKNSQQRVLDVGTGTGCLLVSLLQELPQAKGVGIDVSPAAISVARTNCNRLHVLDRVQLIVSDWFSKVEGRFDIVVANPPYIVDKDIKGLDPDVRDHEPKLALAGGSDGLNSYRIIAESLSTVLKRNGFAVIEIGVNQSRTVCETFEAEGFAIHSIKKDLGDRDRCIVVQMPQISS